MNTPRTDKLHAQINEGNGSHAEDIVTACDFARQLETELAAARAALSDIHLTAHWLAKAGPLSTPDLATAWSHFLHLSAKATLALAEAEVKRLIGKETID